MSPFTNISSHLAATYDYMGYMKGYVREVKAALKLFSFSSKLKLQREREREKGRGRALKIKK